MFLMLGLLVTPSSMQGSLGPSLALAAVLIVVARPLSVWLCLLPFHFSARETWFIAWVGLRGAVPIVLALFPLLAGTPQAGLLFNIAFVVVLTSLLIQGATIGRIARWLGVALPDPSDEQQQRAVFRDFELDPRAPVAEVCAFYGLPMPADAALPLADWMPVALRRPPVAGDQLRIGPSTLVVREVLDGRITRIGIGLQD
jgi:cell volume regulation protein A